MLFLVTAAHAVPGTAQLGTTAGPRQPITLEMLVQDLDASDMPTRLLAARALRHRARTTARRGGRPGSIAELEGRAELAALARLATPACQEVLDEPRLAPACAATLSYIADPSSCSALADAQSGAGPRARRSLARALRRMAATCRADAS